MKVSHEVPLCLLEQSLQFNDYDYCLPHLMDQYEEYRNFFMRSKANGRHIMMDNSLHELGVPYSEDRLFYWLDELQPNEFFVPDYWEDQTQSVVSAKRWIQYQNNYPDTTFIAVVQAKSLYEAVICYQIYKDLGYKKIAFSYGASYYNGVHPHENKAIGKALGRIDTINKIHGIGVIHDNDKIHLLGCSVPQEFGYHKDSSYIESIDTSNPVMAAIQGLKYDTLGLEVKPTVNMNECFEMSLSEIDMKLVNYNVKQFKQINNL
jgi:hypothetical protein